MCRAGRFHVVRNHKHHPNMEKLQTIQDFKIFMFKGPLSVNSNLAYIKKVAKIFININSVQKFKECNKEGAEDTHVNMDIWYLGW